MVSQVPFANKVMVEELSEYLKWASGRFTVHPAAELFPVLEGDEFDRLVESIRQHGVQNPLTFGCRDDDVPVLLDGRNRLRAVERLKEQGTVVTVPVVEFAYPEGTSEVEWIEAQNIDRRHLTDDARATLAAALHEMIAAEAAEAQKATQFNSDTAKVAAEARHAGRSKPSEPQKRDHKVEAARSTVGKVAKKAKVSRHKAKRAIALDKAVKAGTVSPDVQKAVIAGTKKLKDAVPAKPKAKATAKPKVASDDVPQVDDERAAMKALVAKQWDRVKKQFAVAELPLVRRLILEIVKDERKEMKD